MTEPFGRFRRFLRELKRRNVYKVAVTYAAVVFVGLQAVRLLVPATTLPGWADELLIAFAVLGFPIAVVLAWAFEMTADGMRRTPEAEEEPAVGSVYQWAGLAVVVLLAGGVWYATAEDGRAPSSGATATTDTGSRMASTAADSTAAALPARDRPFVAVLPLENLSPSEENQYFAAGIHEEVLNQLSKVSGLGVFARTTMEEYADSEKSVYEIGRELGAEAVLEGSVRRAAGRVRISAQLIDPQSRDHIWSNTYERKVSPEAIFDIQADIAQKIASALETRLTEDERRRIERVPTSSLAAYEAYVQGRDEWHRIWETLDLRHVDRSVQLLERAVRRDSTFAQAHAWLGKAYAARYEFSSDSRWLDSARVAVDRARSLAPQSATVQAAHGIVLRWQDSLQTAERVLRRTVDLQSSNSEAVFTVAVVHDDQSEWAKHVRWATTAARLDPRRSSYVEYAGFGLMNIGMWDAAEAWIRRARALDPANYRAVQHLAWIHTVRDSPQAARRLAVSFLKERPQHPWRLALAGRVALYTEDPVQAEKYLDQVPGALRRALPEESPTRPARIGLESRDQLHLGLARMRVGDQKRGRDLLKDGVATLREQVEATKNQAELRAWLAGGLATLGRTDEALQQLRQSASAGFPRVDLLRIHPLFSNLRQSTGFQRIAEAVRKNRRRYQSKVKGFELNLRPPGANPDSTASKAVAGG